MKIHKQLRSRYNFKQFVLCGKLVKYKNSHYHWKKVNCKSCLNRKYLKNDKYNNALRS